MQCGDAVSFDGLFSGASFDGVFSGASYAGGASCGHAPRA